MGKLATRLAAIGEIDRVAVSEVDRKKLPVAVAANTTQPQAVAEPGPLKDNCLMQRLHGHATPNLWRYGRPASRHYAVDATTFSESTTGRLFCQEQFAHCAMATS